MSNALEALKSLKKLYIQAVKQTKYPKFTDLEKDKFEIIENELKRLEESEMNAETYKEIAERKEKEFNIIHEECVRLTEIKNKQDKILRIIKEKGLERNEILLIKENNFADYMEVMTQLYWGDETLPKKLKTKAEFNLLKEWFK